MSIIRKAHWTDEERRVDVHDWLRKQEAKREAKKEQVAKSVQEKAKKARLKIVKAESKIELAKGKTSLLIAQTKRKVAESESKATLARARIRLDQVKAAGARASEEKWRARGRRVSTLAGGLQRLIVGNGGTTRKGAKKGIKKGIKKGKGYLERQRDNLVDW